MDNPEKVVEVPAYTDIVYPVLPDSAYELPALFAKPTMMFSTEFLHDLIATRKAALANIQAYTTVPKPVPVPVQ